MLDEMTIIAPLKETAREIDTVPPTEAIETGATATTGIHVIVDLIPETDIGVMEVVRRVKVGETK